MNIKELSFYYSSPVDPNVGVGIFVKDTFV